MCLVSFYFNKYYLSAFNTIFMKHLLNIRTGMAVMLLAACCCTTGATAQSRRDNGERADISSRENNIVKRVTDLPEVQAKMQEVNARTRGKQKMRFELHRKPDESIPYYWVKVHEPVGGEYTELYNFFLKQTSYEIMYYDVVKDSLMELAAWRLQRK
jgi:hypothetical protein